MALSILFIIALVPFISANFFEKPLSTSSGEVIVTSPVPELCAPLCEGTRACVAYIRDASTCILLSSVGTVSQHATLSLFLNLDHVVTVDSFSSNGDAIGTFTASSEECQVECLITSGCKAAVWHATSTQCTLKSDGFCPDDANTQRDGTTQSYLLGAKPVFSCVTAQSNIDFGSIISPTTFIVSSVGGYCTPTLSLDIGTETGLASRELDCDVSKFDSLIVRATSTLGESTCAVSFHTVGLSAPQQHCKASITVKPTETGNILVTDGQTTTAPATAECEVSEVTSFPTRSCKDALNTTPLFATTTATAAGLESSCQTAIVVQDERGPVFPSCPTERLEIELGDNNSVLLTPEILGISEPTDDCGSVRLVIEPATLQCSDANTVKDITVTAFDQSENSAQCFLRALVTDKTVPFIVCPGEVTVSVPTSGQKTLTHEDITTEVRDACGISLQVVQAPTLRCDDTHKEGDDRISAMLLVEDRSGNIATCQTVVNVVDTSPPFVKCTDIATELDPATQTVSVKASDIGFGNDACGINSRKTKLTPSVFTCDDYNADRQITLSVEDVNGNPNECQAIVSIRDNEPPNIQCKEIVYIDPDEPISENMVIANEVEVIQQECGNVPRFTLTGGFNRFTNIFPCTASRTTDVFNEHLVTLTATDARNNRASCTSIVHVRDASAPSISCIQTFALSVGRTGSALLRTPTQFLSNVGELTEAECVSNVNLLNVTLSKDTWSCQEDGTGGTLVVRVTDKAQKYAECNVQMTLQDTTNPRVTCQRSPFLIDIADGTFSDADALVRTSSDACGTTHTMDPEVITPLCTEVGQTIPVVVTATDLFGNVDTCSITIRVSDDRDTCATITCDDEPQGVEGGTFEKGCKGRGQSAVCEMTCDDDLVKTGNALCLNGDWELPTCFKPDFCPNEPASTSFGVYEDKCAGRADGETCKLTCIPPAYQIGLNPVCINGAWSEAECAVPDQCLSGGTSSVAPLEADGYLYRLTNPPSALTDNDPETFFVGSKPVNGRGTVAVWLLFSEMDISVCSLNITLTERYRLSNRDLTLILSYYNGRGTTALQGIGYTPLTTIVLTQDELRDTSVSLNIQILEQFTGRAIKIETLESLLEIQDVTINAREAVLSVGNQCSARKTSLPPLKYQVNGEDNAEAGLLFDEEVETTFELQPGDELVLQYSDFQTVPVCGLVLDFPSATQPASPSTTLTLLVSATDGVFVEHKTWTITQSDFTSGRINLPNEAAFSGSNIKLHTTNAIIIGNIKVSIGIIHSINYKPSEHSNCKKLRLKHVASLTYSPNDDHNDKETSGLASILFDGNLNGEFRSQPSTPESPVWVLLQFGPVNIALCTLQLAFPESTGEQQNWVLQLWSLELGETTYGLLHTVIPSMLDGNNAVDLENINVYMGKLMLRTHLGAEIRITEITAHTAVPMIKGKLCKDDRITPLVELINVDASNERVTDRGDVSSAVINGEKIIRSSTRSDAPPFIEFTWSEHDLITCGSSKKIAFTLNPITKNDEKRTTIVVSVRHQGQWIFYTAVRRFDLTSWSQRNIKFSQFFGSGLRLYSLNGKLSVKKFKVIRIVPDDTINIANQAAKLLPQSQQLKQAGEYDSQHDAARKLRGRPVGLH